MAKLSGSNNYSTFCVYTRVNVYYKGQPWEYDDRSPVLTLFKNTVKSWLLYKEYILTRICYEWFRSK